MLINHSKLFRKAKNKQANNNYKRSMLQRHKWKIHRSYVYVFRDVRRLETNGV